MGSNSSLITIHKGHGFSLALAMLFSVGLLVAAFAAPLGTKPIPGHTGSQIQNGSLSGSAFADNLTINDTFVKFVNRSGSNSITFNLSRGNGTTVIGADFINITNTTQATGQRGNVPYGCVRRTSTFTGTSSTVSCSTGEIAVGSEGTCGAGDLRALRFNSALTSVEAVCNSADPTNSVGAVCCKV